jgi:hypothetical protein
LGPASYDGICRDEPTLLSDVEEREYESTLLSDAEERESPSEDRLLTHRLRENPRERPIR